MPRISYPEVLTEAAGVKIVTSPPEEDADTFPPGKIVLKMRKINAASDVRGKSCGFHLTKSKWDPYPWIGYVEKNSPADLAGLKTGDCLLGIDDINLLGLKIKDIATLIRNEEGIRDIIFSIWRYPQKEENDIGIALKGPLPDVARNLANALSGMVRALECPICLESAAPPVSQCVHGHILCVICRPKTSRCPVCRVRLGQGRCLLADKLHIVLRDTFNMNNDETLNKTSVAFEHYNLRDQLFGKNNKKQETPILNCSKKNCTMLKPRQFLLARLLLGSRKKAISADNLTRVSGISEGAAAISNEMTDTSSLRLSLNDRTKSASTGELSRDSETRINESSSRITELSATNTSRQSLSSPQTPIWGGSTDSMSCVQLMCPLLQSCRELVTADSLLEHIKTHALPQIHFYSRSARIPLPLPFGHDAFYIFHHGSNIFFFQCRDETAWMTYPVKIAGHAISNTWEWTLHAWDDNGTEVQLRRHVASLENPLTLSSQHIAPLPIALLLKTINIKISEHPVHDRLYV
ncbi:hypothetical protein ACFW04_006660 [Cataglyphis niger]